VRLLSLYMAIRFVGSETGDLADYSSLVSNYCQKREEDIPNRYLVSINKVRRLGISSIGSPTP
jgi:hypothetical protein